MKRDLNRRAVMLVLAGGMITQAIYGALRMLSLDHDRPYFAAINGVDPAVDIAINWGIAAASVLITALLFTGRTPAWWLAMAVLLVGVLDALRLSEAPHGGIDFLGLLGLRLAVVYLFCTPLVRAVFAIRH